MAAFYKEYNKWIDWTQSIKLKKNENYIEILENLKEHYKQAMSFTAFGALINTDEVRKEMAYCNWVNLKLKLSDSKEFQKITLLKCLKADTEVMKKFGIDMNLSDYNLEYVCLTELKFLSQGKGNLIISMETTLDELESMGSDWHFVLGVFLLSCHALQLRKRKSISDYIKKALHKLESIKSKTLNGHCMMANLQFYKIVEKLYLRSQAIAMQVNDDNFTVKDFKLSNDKQHANYVEGINDIWPTCGGINIIEDMQCAEEFMQVLNLWDNCLENNMDAFAKDWEPQLTLETIVVCGEYCRLFKFKNIEEKVWKLAYKLAAALQDYNTCVYVTSRSISLKCINDDWIRESEKYVERVKNSSKNMELDVVAIFWLSLADFYLDCKKVDEAKKLIEKVKLLQNYHFLKNLKVCIYNSTIQFRNCYALSENPSQEQYCQLLVEIIDLLKYYYTLNEFWEFGSVKYKLFCYEQIFESLCNTAIPLSSLLVYHEIVGHIFCVKKIALTLGLTIRIGQLLKYECYIYLLRMRLNICEAILQDFEHILCLENFRQSMKTKHVKKTRANSQSNVSSGRINSAATDANRGQAGTVPAESKKKNFTPPDFLEHSSSCECFTCSNLPYQSLYFSGAHLRAQLYRLLKYTDEAEQHFYGACQIKTRLEENDTSKSRIYKRFKWGYQQSYVVDVILYMLDFSSFIADFYPEEKEDALALIEEAREIAEKNDMERHCVAAFIAEMYFQYHFYHLKDEKVLKDLSVPNDIPITFTEQPKKGCVTPKQQITSRYSLRPRKLPAPPAVPAKKGNVDYMSQADEAAPKRSARNVRRKILVNEKDEIAEEPPLRKSKRLVEKRQR